MIHISHAFVVDLFRCTRVLVALALAACAGGCGSSDIPSADAAAASGTNKKNSVAAKPSTALAVLDRMTGAYRKSRSYADTGEVVLVWKGADGPVRQASGFSVSFARPNKLRMHLYQANVVCDGRHLWASIEDLPGQVLKSPAPKKISMESIHSDPILGPVLTEGIVGGSIQLALLLTDSPLEHLLKAAEAPPELLLTRSLGDAECYRVRLKQSDGSMVFWIDEQSYVLRRIEFPTKELKKSIAEQDEKVSDVKLTAEFTAARLNATADGDAFRFEAPADATIVEQFVYRDPLLGQPSPDFTVRTLDGESVTRESLAGKVVVIDFWATWCKVCFDALPELERVFQQYKDDDRVAFLAVNVEDEADVPDKAVESPFKGARLTIPIYRDPQLSAHDAFAVRGMLPATVILGPDGRVQDYIRGFDERLAETLPAKLEALLAGKDLETAATENLPAASTAEIPKPTIAPRSEPATVKLQSLWKCEELKQPGNILVVAGSEGPDRIFVHDGYLAVAELGLDGKAVQRHEFDLPTGADEAVVSYLRTGTNADGTRYFAASAGSQQQFHLFDEKFKRILSYPQDERHDGITDVQLADLDGDGSLEIGVAYWGAIGVQCVSLKGELLWRNRAVEDVFRLAVTQPDPDGHRQLLCAHNRGTLVGIDHEGRETAPRPIENGFLRMVFATDLDGDGTSDLCGITSARLGDDTLVGLSLDGSRNWRHPLPRGLQIHPPFEMVTSGQVLDGSDSVWVVAGSDGTIMFVAADGTKLDEFHYGTAPSGMGVAHLDGSPVLLVATNEGIEAWKVSE